MRNVPAVWLGIALMLVAQLIVRPYYPSKQSAPSMDAKLLRGLQTFDSARESKAERKVTFQCRQSVQTLRDDAYDTWSKHKLQLGRLYKDKPLSVLVCQDGVYLVAWQFTGGLIVQEQDGEPYFVPRVTIPTWIHKHGITAVEIPQENGRGVSHALFLY